VVSTSARPPTIAVVIPAFNGGKYVESAVRSVLSQSLMPAEVVVVDDGSTDDTAERVRCLAAIQPTIKLVRRDNAGVSAARNLGVRNTSADLIAFLDCDDFWYPFKLAHQTQFLAMNPDCVVVGTHLDYFGEDGRLPGVVGEPTPDERQDDIRRARYMPIQLSSWVVRRWAFHQAGEFDEQLAQGEDVDLLARLARLGTVRILPGSAQGGYRLHKGSASSDSFFAARDAVRFVRARLAARDAGADLTIEEYRRNNPTKPPTRSDRARFAFRESGVEFGRRHWTQAFARMVHAMVLDPRYAVRRSWVRVKGGR
jgi:glycosyltransferase involved in cell wall biosynthesis